MKMNMKKIMTILVIGLFTMGIVAAGHTGQHGAAYMTPDGLAELKSGSLESGDYTVWNDHDVQHHKTTTVIVDGVEYIITYKVAGGSGAKIVGVEKVVVPQPDPVVPGNETDPVIPGNETEPVVPENDTPVVPVKNDTDPIVPVKNDTEPVVPVKNETEPVVPGNETEPVVPGNETDPVVPVDPVVPANNTVENNTEHASGDDVTVAPATNNNVQNATKNNDNNADENGVEMKRAGNPYFLAIIAIFLLIGAVAYNKRD